MPDSKQGTHQKKCSSERQFNVGDEVELLTWRIFGSKGTITSVHSSPFRHPFHVRTDRGYTIGVFPHEIRHAIMGEPATPEKLSACPKGTKCKGKRKRG